MVKMHTRDSTAELSVVEHLAARPSRSTRRRIQVEKERVMRTESDPVRIEGDSLSDQYRWYAADAFRLA